MNLRVFSNILFFRTFFTNALATRAEIGRIKICNITEILYRRLCDLDLQLNI
jgi:hypothetical protein